MFIKQFFFCWVMFFCLAFASAAHAAEKWEVVVNSNQDLATVNGDSLCTIREAVKAVTSVPITQPTNTPYVFQDCTLTHAGSTTTSYNNRNVYHIRFASALDTQTITLQRYASLYGTTFDGKGLTFDHLRSNSLPYKNIEIGNSNARVRIVGACPAGSGNYCEILFFWSAHFGGPSAGGGKLSLENIVFDSGSWSAVYLSYGDPSDQSVSIHNCEFKNSFRPLQFGDSRGGGLNIEGGTEAIIDISDSSFHHNEAGTAGGVNISGQDITFSRVDIYQNKAIEKSAGGALVFPTKSLVVDHSLIADNDASINSMSGTFVTSGREGGGLYIGDDWGDHFIDIDIANTAIVNNKSYGDGAGIFYYPSTAKNTAIFNGNTTGYTNLRIKNSIVADNHVTGPLTRNAAGESSGNGQVTTNQIFIPAHMTCPTASSCFDDPEHDIYVYHRFDGFISGSIYTQEVNLISEGFNYLGKGVPYARVASDINYNFFNVTPQPSFIPLQMNFSQLVSRAGKPSHMKYYKVFPGNPIINYGSIAPLPIDYDMLWVMRPDSLGSSIFNGGDGSDIGPIEYTLDDISPPLDVTIVADEQPIEVAKPEISPHFNIRSVWPNPVRNTTAMVKIRLGLDVDTLASGEKKFTIELHNTQRQRVMHVNASDISYNAAKQVLTWTNIPTLASGVYFITIKAESWGQSTTQKLVFQ